MKAQIIDTSEMDEILNQAELASRLAPRGTVFDELTVMSHDDGRLTIRTQRVPRGFWPARLKKRKRKTRNRRRR